MDAVEDDILRVAYVKIVKEIMDRIAYQMVEDEENWARGFDMMELLMLERMLHDEVHKNG